MLCKLRWIVLYTVHFTAFSLGGGVFIRTRCIIIVILRNFYREFLTALVNAHMNVPCQGCADHRILSPRQSADERSAFASAGCCYHEFAVCLCLIRLEQKLQPLTAGSSYSSNTRNKLYTTL